MCTRNVLWLQIENRNRGTTVNLHLDGLPGQMSTGRTDDFLGTEDVGGSSSRLTATRSYWEKIVSMRISAVPEPLP